MIKVDRVGRLVEDFVIERRGKDEDEDEDEAL